uniref:Uncharacterized protein n=1 Tax=Arundo donax TaxID=35708 RepID=A0A0A9SQD3_ARUDO
MIAYIGSSSFTFVGCPILRWDDALFSHVLFWEIFSSDHCHVAHVHSFNTACNCGLADDIACSVGDFGEESVRI